MRRPKGSRGDVTAWGTGRATPPDSRSTCGHRHRTADRRTHAEAEERPRKDHHQQAPGSRPTRVHHHRTAVRRTRTKTGGPPRKPHRVRAEKGLAGEWSSGVRGRA
ncbi:hypothetical protein, partial [Streptomyces sp. NPDC004976]